MKIDSNLIKYEFLNDPKIKPHYEFLKKYSNEEFGVAYEVLPNKILTEVLIGEIFNKSNLVTYYIFLIVDKTLKINITSITTKDLFKSFYRKTNLTIKDFEKELLTFPVKIDI